jgi:hypothetical protein
MVEMCIITSYSPSKRLVAACRAIFLTVATFSTFDREDSQNSQNFTMKMKNLKNFANHRYRFLVYGITAAANAASECEAYLQVRHF